MSKKKKTLKQERTLEQVVADIRADFEDDDELFPRPTVAEYVRRVRFATPTADFPPQEYFVAALDQLIEAAEDFKDRLAWEAPDEKKG